MARTSAPLLLPLFRSRAQARLLTRVYLQPDKPAPLAELAKELELDRAGVKREADRLEAAGLVVSDRVGRQRLLRPNTESPYYRDLYGLLLKAFGPATLIGTELAWVGGVERAYLYGSWAARYLGEHGPDPVDIDVIVIGRPSSGMALTRAAGALSARLGREVNITAVAPDEWDAAGSGFLQELKSRPLVPVRIDSGTDAA